MSKKEDAKRALLIRHVGELSAEDLDGALEYVEGLLRVAALQAGPTAKWRIWGGWGGNNDRRIEDAKCTSCGYEHGTVYGSTARLGGFCGKCGARMVGVEEY